jgi:hypothetical protein
MSTGDGNVISAAAPTAAAAARAAAAQAPAASQSPSCPSLPRGWRCPDQEPLAASGGRTESEGGRASDLPVALHSNEYPSKCFSMPKTASVCPRGICLSPPDEGSYEPVPASPGRQKDPRLGDGEGPQPSVHLAQ